MRQFDLTTQWQLESAIDRVWDAIVTVEKWPHWWRFVHAVEELEKGDAEGLGALRTYTWSSKLPYRLTFAMRVTVVRRRPHRQWPLAARGRRQHDPRPLRLDRLHDQAVDECTGSAAGACLSLESPPGHGRGRARAGEISRGSPAGE
jgi:hypothetical protein